MALVQHIKASELASEAGLSATEARTLVAGLQTHSVSQLSGSAQAAYRALADALAATPPASLDDLVAALSTDLAGAAAVARIIDDVAEIGVDHAAVLVARISDPAVRDFAVSIDGEAG